MENLISKAELARIAGVSKAATTKITASTLADAMVGRKVNADHPLVVEWLASHGASPPPPQLKSEPTPKKPKAPSTKNPRKSPSTRKSPPKVERPAKKEVNPADETPTPSNYPTQIGGYAVEDLEHMTVREVLMRYGSIDGFKRFVESMKNIAEYKLRELRVQQQRGELIEREKVAGAVFPLIDVAFSRLVSDVPDSITQLIIARVESGGEDTVADVQKIIRDANSRALKNAKQSIDKTGLLKSA